MTKHHNELLADTCWVYVQQEGEGNYTIAITYNEDFKEQEEFAERPLLLWRSFNDTLTAAGYRIALKGLSEESLLEAVRRYNETEKNEKRQELKNII